MPQPPKTYAHSLCWMHQHWAGGRDDGPVYVSLSWTDFGSFAPPHAYMAWIGPDGKFTFSLTYGFQPLHQYAVVRLDGLVEYRLWPPK